MLMGQIEGLCLALFGEVGGNTLNNRHLCRLGRALLDDLEAAAFVDENLEADLPILQAEAVEGSLLTIALLNLDQLALAFFLRRRNLAQSTVSACVENLVRSGDGHEGRDDGNGLRAAHSSGC